jgi:hypothetical protein
MDLDVPLDLETETPTALVQVGIFLLSLLDDVAIVGLSRMGIHIPGLNWVGPIVIIVMIIHWLEKIGHYLIKRYQN